MRTTRTLFRIGLVFALVTGAPAGCDLLTGGSDSATVTLEIDSSDGSQVLLITSMDYTRAVDQDGMELFYLHDSDTTWVATPYQGTFKVEPSGAGIGGFYAQAAEAENPEATVSMRALVNGKEVYFDEKVLTGEGLRFYYRRF